MRKGIVERGEMDDNWMDAKIKETICEKEQKKGNTWDLSKLKSKQKCKTRKEQKRVLTREKDDNRVDAEIR